MKRTCFVVASLIACFILINCTFLKSHSRLPTSQGSLVKQALLSRGLLLQNLDISEIPLHVFDMRDLVSLLDGLVCKKLEMKTRYPEWQSAPFDYHTSEKTVYVAPKKTVHVSFVGDSRIRQLFASFYKALPKYDVSIFPESEAKFSWTMFVPPQMIVYSELLGVMASYYWFNLLVENEGHDVFKFLLGWLGYPVMNSGETYTSTPLPDVLIIGIGPHHMLKRHIYAPEDVYFKKLRELVPVLRNISQYCQIIWLPMHPNLEMFGSSSSDNTDVNAQKILHYNQMANSILSEGGIPILNSASPIVEEYIRSCLTKPRKDGLTRGFFSCLDHIHPGSVAIQDIMQILYNLMLFFDEFTDSNRI